MTLRPVGRPLRLPAGSLPLLFGDPRSPDGSLLALGPGTEESPRRIDFVDLRLWRLRGGVRFPKEVATGPVAWVSGSRGFVVSEDDVFAFDAHRLAMHRVGAVKGAGLVDRVVSNSYGAGFLDNSVARLEPARLRVIGRAGLVRSVVLARISAGTGSVGRRRYCAWVSRRPGLVADPARPFVYVVGRRLVAQVDMRTLAVRYHEVALGLRSPAWRSGWEVQASWLGEGRLFVGRTDSTAGICGSPPDDHARSPRTIDTRTWRVGSAPAGGYAAGGRFFSAGGGELRAFTSDGRPWFRIADREFATGGRPDVNGRLLYIGQWNGQTRTRVLVVDLEKRRVVHRIWLARTTQFFVGRTE